MLFVESALTSDNCSYSTSDSTSQGIAQTVSVIADDPSLRCPNQGSLQTRSSTPDLKILPSFKFLMPISVQSAPKPHGILVFGGSHEAQDRVQSQDEAPHALYFRSCRSGRRRRIGFKCEIKRLMPSAAQAWGAKQRSKSG